MDTEPHEVAWEKPPEFPQLCRYLAERSPQPMVAVEGPTHIVRYINPAFHRLAGSDAADLIGRPFVLAVPESAANHCAAMLDRVFATGSSEALAEQEHAAHGAPIRGRPLGTYWSYLAWAILGRIAGDERPAGVMIQVTDATGAAAFRRSAAAINEALLLSGLLQHELKGEADRLNAKLRESESHEHEARLEAQAASLGKDVFLATLSHEVRTPLSAILGWAVMLRSPEGGGPRDPDMEHGLAVIERNARALGKLIEDVLDVARVVSGKFALDKGPVDLVALARGAIDTVRPAAAAKGIALVFEEGEAAKEGPAPITLVGDASRLNQAILNLLNNALKFTPARGGGRVTVRVELAGDLARVVVSDTGMGITPDVLPLIFERFAQAETGTTRRFDGLGLGLTIVRHIAELHGGTVTAASEGEGRGATFTLELPAAALGVGGENEAGRVAPVV